MISSVASFLKVRWFRRVALLLSASVLSGALALTAFSKPVASQTIVMPSQAMQGRNVYTTQDLDQVLPGIFPMQWPVPKVIEHNGMLVKTSIDIDLQSSIDAYLQSRRPAFGAAAVIRPSTGEILCLSSYTSDKRWKGKNLALVGSFAAASVFKLITAAGVLSEGHYTRLDALSFIGSSTAMPAAWNTKPTTSKKARWVTLERAFADSINPVFGKLGQHQLGLEGLGAWAQTFGWNQKITEQLDIMPSKIDLSESALAAAQIGSGYTQRTTLSPLHGAAIAAAVVNGGTFIRPGVVSAVADSNGNILYRRPVLDGDIVLSEHIAAELGLMMEATIDYGTAEGAYKGREGVLEDLIVGGKTGTLTGQNPQGKTQWLVGWAKDKQTGEDLAFATVMIKGKKTGSTSAKELSKKILRCYFGRLHPEKELAVQAAAKSKPKAQPKKSTAKSSKSKASSKSKKSSSKTKKSTKKSTKKPTKKKSS